MNDFCGSYKYFLLILFGLVGCNALFNSIAVGIGLDYPYTTFLFNPNDFLADFLKVAASYPGEIPEDFNNRTSIERSYFMNNPYGGLSSLDNNDLTHFHMTPLSTLLYLFIRELINNNSGLYLYFIMSIIWLFPLIYMPIKIAKNNKKTVFLVLALLISYPTLFVLTRGNITAGFTGISLITGLYLCALKKYPFFQIILLSIAINFRPNAIIFLLTPFIFYNFKDALRLAFLMGISTISLFLISIYISNLIYDDYTIANFLKGLNIYYELYVVNYGGLNFGSSALGMIKVLFYSIGFLSPNIDLINLIILLAGLCIFILSVIIFFTKKLTPYEALFISSCLYVLMSSVFADYHLIVFAIFPILFISNNYNVIEKDESYIIPMVTSALILAPKNFIFIKGISLQIVLNPLILIIAIILILYKTIKNKKIKI